MNFASNLGLEYSVDKPINTIEAELFEFGWRQWLKQILKGSLVRVNDFIFRLQVQAVDSVAEPHEALFLRFILEGDQVPRWLYIELKYVANIGLVLTSEKLSWVRRNQISIFLCFCRIFDQVNLNATVSITLIILIKQLLKIREFLHSFIDINCYIWLLSFLITQLQWGISMYRLSLQLLGLNNIGLIFLDMLLIK